MADSTTRLAVQIQAGLTNAPVSVFKNCVVDHVVTGGAVGGADAVFITGGFLGADVIPSNYLDMAPPAGATVRVEFCDGSPTVHGRVLGNPTL